MGYATIYDEDEIESNQSCATIVIDVIFLVLIIYIFYILLLVLIIYFFPFVI